MNRIRTYIFITWKHNYFYHVFRKLKSTEWRIIRIYIVFTFDWHSHFLNNRNVWYPFYHNAQILSRWYQGGSECDVTSFFHHLCKAAVWSRRFYGYNFLAYLSWRLKVSYWYQPPSVVRPSVNFFFKRLLLQNHWTNFH